MTLSLPFFAIVLLLYISLSAEVDSEGSLVEMFILGGVFVWPIVLILGMIFYFISYLVYRINKGKLDSIDNVKIKKLFKITGWLLFIILIVVFSSIGYFEESFV